MNLWAARWLEHARSGRVQLGPLLTSLVVALGGLTLGWLVYRNVNSPAEDKLQIPLLKNKYYFDEAYDFLFVKPAIWFAENLRLPSGWTRGLIDGILHHLRSRHRRHWLLPSAITSTCRSSTTSLAMARQMSPTGSVANLRADPNRPHPAVSDCLRWSSFVVVGAALYFFLLA